MGSTPHAHAMANVEKPHDQGVVAIIAMIALVGIVKKAANNKKATAAIEKNK